MVYDVAQTSLEAFQSVVLSDRQEEVFRALLLHGPCSNALLSERLGWAINRVTPRVLELRRLGVVRHAGTSVSPVTGRSENVWRAIEGGTE